MSGGCGRCGRAFDKGFECEALGAGFLARGFGGFPALVGKRCHGFGMAPCVGLGGCFRCALAPFVGAMHDEDADPYADGAYERRKGGYEAIEGYGFEFNHCFFLGPVA